MAVPAQIPKLSATNYASWSTDMKFLLLEKNCYDIVTGAEVEPVGESAVAAKKEFLVRKRLALATIYLNISPEYRKIIEALDEPKDVWSTLATNFRPDNRAFHMQLFSDLIACKIETNETINLFSSRIQHIAGQLKSSGKPVDELYLSYQLLRHLPSKFDQVVQGILRWKDSAFVYKNILLELIAEETRLHLRDQDKSGSSASKRELFHVEKARIRCSNCGKPNHLKEDCWFLQSSNRGRVSFSKGRGSRYSSPSPRRKSRGTKSRPTNSSVYRSSSESSDRRNSSRESRDSSPYRSHPNSRKYSSPKRNDSPQRRFRSPERRQGTSQRTGKRKPDTKGNVLSFFLVEANVNYHVKSNTWLFDTAASHHFCKKRELFSNFRPVEDEHMVLAVNGVKFPIEGRGDVKVNFGYIDLVLKDVLFSPKLRKNLISGPKLDKNGFEFSGGNGRVTAWSGNMKMFVAKLKKGLYYVSPSVNQASNVEYSTHSHSKLNLWHHKFAHANLDYIVRTSQLNAVKGMPSLKKSRNFSCDSCKINKHRKVSFHTVEGIRSRRPLDLLYLDVWGPSNTTGLRGERYYLSITDDYSRRMSLYPMFEKSDVFDIFEKHVNRAERSLNLKVKAIRTDNGSEFVNRNFENFCADMGIKHEKTNIYTPQQNGVAERLNRTVIDGARTILYESGLDKSFWPEAILSFVHVWNRLCHHGQTKTPIELYTGSKPSVRHLKKFGSVVFVGIPSQLRQKLDPKARKGIMVGYALGTKGYRVYLPDLEKVIETCNVSFPKSEQNDSDRSGAVMEPENSSYSWTGQSESIEPSDEPDVDLPGTAQSPPSSSVSSDEESDDEEQGDGGATTTSSPAKDTTWRRNVVKRPDGSRNDVYYYDENRKGRLRSLEDVKKHCKKENLKFQPDLFDFRGKNLYVGPVNPQPGASGIQCKKSKS